MSNNSENNELPAAAAHHWSVYIVYTSEPVLHSAARQTQADSRTFITF